MKKNRLHSVLIVAATITAIFSSGTVHAAWMGNSAIQVNGTWYQPSTNPATWPGSTFTTQAFTTTTLTLGGQFETWDNSQVDACSWNSNTGLDYVITQASTDKLSGHAGFTNTGFARNNNT